jgi:peptide/nickel transport system substrate-binding protein
MLVGSIISPTAFNADPENFWQNPIGAGPFKFDEWVVGEYVHLVKFDDYYRDVSTNDVYFYSNTEDVARTAKFTSGEADLLIEIDPDQKASLAANPLYKYTEITNLDVGYYCFNFNESKYSSPAMTAWLDPTDGIKIRQAMNYAINETFIIEDILAGLAIESNSPLPPGMWSALVPPEVTDYGFNFALAQDLMEECGFNDGNRLPVKLQIPPGDTGLESAVAIQQFYDDIYIDLEIVQSIDWSTHFGSAADEAQWDLFAIGWIGDNGDPDNFFSPLLRTGSSMGYSGWSNETFDALIDDGKILMDQAARIPLYEEAQRIVSTEVPWVFRNHGITVYLTDKTFTNEAMSVMGYLSLSEIVWND